MEALSKVIKTDDWKSEKHVPVIECPDSVAADTYFDVTVTLGKATAHPNTTEHHIRWISLYYLPEGAVVPFHVARAEFCAHGESTQGANQGPVYTNHAATASLKLAKSGTLQAVAYCNIHGLWESSKSITVA